MIFLRKLFDKLGFNKNINLYRFPCCSYLNGELFIIGMEMHKYYRSPIRCNDCETYSVCDRCIGHTNNGYYDVNSIFENPTEVDIKKCMSMVFS